MFMQEQIEHLEKTSGKRNEILDKIVARAKKREVQHMVEIIQEIRELCNELEETMK